MDNSTRYHAVKTGATHSQARAVWVYSLTTAALGLAAGFIFVVLPVILHSPS